MAVSHALPRQVALYTETAFVTGGPADWAANGTFFYVIEPDTSGVVQATVENANNRLRPLAKHPNIRTLRNSSLSFGMYMHGSTANAAEAAAAVTYHVADLLYAALGGRDLGYGIGVASSGGEAANEVEVDSDPGYAVGDWIFLYDTSADDGEFYRIEAIAAGPPVTLTLDRDKHFTPDVGGADRIYAVIDCYIHQAASTQHDNANHKTMQFLVQGDGVDDVVECKGCKPAVSIDAITAGEPSRLTFDVMVTTFAGADEATKEDFGNATPVGEAGVVPGIATTTKFKLADFGSPLATVTARGSVTVNSGVAYERIMGPNGHEGVHGHVNTLDDSTMEVIVPHDGQYNAEFRAGTLKHALVQVGNSLQAWGVYMPRMEYGSEPTRSDEGGLTGSSLMFRGLENNASPGALTGDNLEKWRSPFHILIVA